MYNIHSFNYNKYILKWIYELTFLVKQNEMKMYTVNTKKVKYRYISFLVINSFLFAFTLQFQKCACYELTYVIEATNAIFYAC